MLQKQLERTAAQHSVASQNIANVNTPGYKTKELVSFSSLLNEVSDGLSSQPKDGLPERLDGNNVNIDKELGEVKKNALVHNAYSQLLAFKIRQLQRAISQ